MLGEDPRRFRRTTREQIGYMPQLFTLYPDLTADENVDFVASLFGMLVRRRRRRVREVLELVQLRDVRDRRAGQLSGGMQRRLELACALVHEPALLLLDEPTAGIDPILRQTIWDELARLKDDGPDADRDDAVRDRGRVVRHGRAHRRRPPHRPRRARGPAPERGRRRRHRGRDRAPVRPGGARRPEGIRAARSTGLRSFRVVADDAGTVTPSLDTLVEAEGGTLVAAREVHLTFDEVFTTLVERAAAERGEDVAGERRHRRRPEARRMNPFIGAAKVVTRLLAFIGRELVEVRRRPGALVSLVFGPFLVMAIFGLGYNGYKKPLPTLVVIPPESGPAHRCRDVPRGRRAGPRDRGRRPRRLDGDGAARGRRGRRSSRSRRRTRGAASRPGSSPRSRSGSTSRTRSRLRTPASWRASSRAPSTARSSGGPPRRARRRRSRSNIPDADRIPPEVIAAPTKATVVNIAPTVPNVVGYFGPAVLALILQHMAVTLIALSVVRDRTSGVIEVFRISPVSAWEVVAGQDPRLRLPERGHRLREPHAARRRASASRCSARPPRSPASWRSSSTASLGLGLLISIISDSERQAVQLSLLVLLASVFFSGFVLPISEFSEPVRIAAHAIPVTSGIPLIQDVMLRGRDPRPVAGVPARGAQHRSCCSRAGSSCDGAWPGPERDPDVASSPTASRPVTQAQGIRGRDDAGARAAARRLSRMHQDADRPRGLQPVVDGWCGRGHRPDPAPGEGRGRGVRPTATAAGRAGRATPPGRSARSRSSRTSSAPRSPRSSSGRRCSGTGGGSISRPIRTEVVEAVEEEAERLYRLVEDLLAVVRHDADGARRSSFGPLLLQRWLPDVIAAEVEAAPSLRVRSAIPADLPPILADDGALTHVIRNLLANAVRHAPEGMPVEIVGVARDGRRHRQPRRARPWTGHRARGRRPPVRAVLPCPVRRRPAAPGPVSGWPQRGVWSRRWAGRSPRLPAMVAREPGSPSTCRSRPRTTHARGCRGCGREPSGLDDPGGREPGHGDRRGRDHGERRDSPGDQRRCAERRDDGRGG